jgi:hypothetical protein
MLRGVFSQIGDLLHLISSCVQPIFNETREHSAFSRIPPRFVNEPKQLFIKTILPGCGNINKKKREYHKVFIGRKKKKLRHVVFVLFSFSFPHARRAIAESIA